MSYTFCYANRFDIANRTYLSVWHSIAGPPIMPVGNPYSEFSAKVMLDTQCCFEINGIGQQRYICPGKVCVAFTFRKSGSQ